MGFFGSTKKEESPITMVGVTNSDALSLGSMTAHDTEALYQKGIATVRDLISPPAIKLSPNMMQIGDIFARTYFVIAYPR